MGTAFNHLKEDHEYIKKSLIIFKRIFMYSEPREIFNNEDLSECVKFNIVFTNMNHSGKEDHILYKSFIEKGISTTISEEINKFIDEHKLFNEFIQNVRDSLSDNPQALVSPGFIAGIREYIDHMEDHITNENVILFPTIEDFLSDKEQDYFCKQFDMHEAHIMESCGNKDIKINIDLLYQKYS